MTLDDVMKLEGRELDAAVSELLGFSAKFSDNWSAAMEIREWARGLSQPQRVRFFNDTWDAMRTRLSLSAAGPPTFFLNFEAVDLCRAALLVSP